MGKRLVGVAAVLVFLLTVAHSEYSRHVQRIEGDGEWLARCSRKKALAAKFGYVWSCDWASDYQAMLAAARAKNFSSKKSKEGGE